jgi:hypothetical protein
MKNSPEYSPARSADQAWVVGGMAFAVAVSSAAIALLEDLLVSATPRAITGGERVAYAMSWSALTLIPLLACILVVANWRFFDPAAIDGSRPAAGSPLDLQCRVLHNTLEQSVLAIVAHAAFAVVAPAAWLSFVPALAMWFVIARLAFWVGYLTKPRLRAFGFASTFFPTAIVLVIDLTRLWTGGEN